MSEPDDKPRADAADSQSKSLFDSEWDALLGDAASSMSGATVEPLQPASAQPASVGPEPAGAGPEPAGAGPAPAGAGPAPAGAGPEPAGAGPEPAGAGPKPAKAEAEAEAEAKAKAKAKAKAEAEAEAKAEAAERLRVADSVPRNSTARASVSGAYLGPKPRPAPSSLPRYERPEGVSPYYDDPDEPYGDPEADTGDYGMAPMIQPAVLEASTMAANLGLGTRNSEDGEPDADADADAGGRGGAPAAKVIELASARAGATAQARRPQPDASAEAKLLAEPPAGGEGGGSRGTLLVIGALAIVGLIVVAVTQLGGKPGGSSELAGEGTPPPTPVSGTGGESERGTERTQPLPGGPKPSGETGETGETGASGDTETGDEYGDTGDETGGWQPKPQPKSNNVDPRDPSLIPPGTPEDHAKAFLKLPVSIHDGPPVAGIGPTGIHIDAISTSRGRQNTECDNPTERFSIGVAKYVNVCFRVVHPREPESLRVIWEKDGKVTRRGRVRIPDLHAYTTRAYLLLRPEYVGDWRVRIVPEGEESIDLAVAEFVITE